MHIYIDLHFLFYFFYEKNIVYYGVKSEIFLTFRRNNMITILVLIFLSLAAIGSIIIISYAPYLLLMVIALTVILVVCEIFKWFNK